MDPALLTTDAFWADPTPLAFDAVAIPAGLEGHVLFATSGSSGIPKWVALSKKALLVSAAAVNRDDPYQRGKVSEDRQKAVAELDRVTSEIDQAKKTIGAIEEEARQGGVPPGWIR